MATFNGAKFLKQQIFSIIEQLGPEDELIISDDGSTDNTLHIAKEFGDPRIKIIHNNLERGYSSNFCNAITHSKGEVIFLSDQDDIWLPNKVQTCLDALKKSSFVVHDAKIVNSELELISHSYFNQRQVKRGFFPNLLKIGYLGCCMAFERDVLLKAMPMPLKNGVITHDSWLTLVSELYFDVVHVNEPLILYRRHGGNVSNGGKSEGNNFIYKCYIRIYSIFKLMYRF
jgi:glycosyltransferase involved in cell wall biosynthesis